MLFLTRFFSIFFVNIILSGDNALAIAMASKDLPAKHKRFATIIGSMGAVVMLLALTFIAVYLLNIPFVKLAGGLLLVWIAIKLLVENEEENQKVEVQSHLWGAVKTIIVADVVMSLDNVVAIAGVSAGNLLLIALGLTVSIPVVIWGSNLIGYLMKRWPVTIIFGAGILGWTAGEMVLGDKRVGPLLEFSHWSAWAVPAVFAVFVISAGIFIANRAKES